MDEIASLLPHEAPMILLTGYEEPESDESVEAYVDIGESSPFYEASSGGVPSCVALEYMAQATALIVGLHRRRRGEAPKIGFVLGSRRLVTRIPFFRRGERYRVRSECTYRDEEFGSFDCEISDAAGLAVAAGRITVFQPEDGLSPENMEKFA